MRICVISRPPLREITKKFHQRRHHIFRRIEIMGHDVESFVINPLRIPNHYLAYGLGVAISPFRFGKMKPDLILADDLESSLAAVFIRSIFRVPFVFDFIDDYTLIARYDERVIRYHILRYLERKIPVLADLVIVATPQIRKFCREEGIPEKKLRLIPNGVDTERFKPGVDDGAMRKRFHLKDNKVILFVGKINKYYNLEVIFRAIPDVLKDFPDTKFLFVGDGNYLDHLRALSHKLKIEEAVIFTGFLPPEEIPAITSPSTLCVFSLPNDGALAIYEYLACAKPLVLPRGGRRKWVSLVR